jgi:hypothetical protein
MEGESKKPLKEEWIEFYENNTAPKSLQNVEKITHNFLEHNTKKRVAFVTVWLCYHIPDLRLFESLGEQMCRLKKIQSDLLIILVAVDEDPQALSKIYPFS